MKRANKRSKSFFLLSTILLAQVFGTGNAVIASEVGSISGDFSVSPFGTAGYRIPIATPPGVNGMQPEIALVYASGSSKGPLGVGWGISGLSTISRCTQTIDQDGQNKGFSLTAEDRFCLDGQRLMLDSGVYGNAGASYRTEIESFQYAESVGQIASPGSGPQSFVVRDKAGLEREYGNTAASRIEADGQTTVVSWAVNKIRDKRGNYIEYKYGGSETSTGTPEYWPTEIIWRNLLGVQVGKVLFVYDTNRPDKQYGYTYGQGQSNLTKRLNKIQVYAGGASSLVREYRLSYEISPTTGLSHLSRLDQCDPAGACLAPTVFDYDHGTSGFASTPTTLGNMANLKLADINGDGRPDYVYTSNGTWWIRFGGGGGTINTGISHAGLFEADAQPVDFNGDGYQDLMVPGTALWVKLQSTGSTLIGPIYTNLAHENAYDDEVLFIDLDGDALPELLFKKNEILKFYRNSTSGFIATAVDTTLPIKNTQKLFPFEFDGDGITDVLVSTEGCSPGSGGGGGSSGGGGGGGGGGGQQQQNASNGPGGGPGGGVTASSSTTLTCLDTAGVLEWDDTISNLVMAGSSAPGGLREPVLLDVNGDGLTDVAYADFSALGQWELYINKGGAFGPADWLGGWVEINADNYANVQVLDYNGDGWSDLMIHEDALWKVMLSNGTGFDPKFSTGTNNVGFQSAMSTDINGDGQTDLLFYDSGWKTRYATGSFRGLLSGITDGLGANTSILYSSLAASFNDYIYEGHNANGLGGAPLVSPQISHFAAPIPLVYRVAADLGFSEGSNPQYAGTFYKYAGAKVNKWGRGFLGFEKIEAYNINTNITSVNHHRQDFPYTGMVESAWQKMPDTIVQAYSTPSGWVPPSTVEGQKISETANVLDKIGYASNTRYFLYIKTSTETQYDYGTSNSIRRTVTNTTYDTWGNPSNISATIDDAAGGNVHTISAVNTYDNSATWTSTAKWCPGRLMQTAVTHARPLAGISETRTSSFTYDLTYCQVKSETVEPNTNLWMTKTYHFDNFGNRKKVIVAGAGISSRTTRTDYDSDGLYPETLTNALNHIETRVFDPKFGVVTSQTGPNDLTTSFEFDSFGRLIKTTAPRTTVFTDISYAWCTTCVHPDAVYAVTSTGSDGSQAIVEFDRLGREVLTKKKLWDGQFAIRESHFDAHGLVYASNAPYIEGQIAPRCWNYKQYDNLGRMTLESRPFDDTECDDAVPSRPPANPPSHSVSTSYAYSGLVTTTTTSHGAEQRTVTREENVMSRLVKVSETLGATIISTQYDYDALGNMNWVQDDAGNVTTSLFDRLGHKKNMSDPDMGNWLYTYNVLGELLTQTDANVVTITMIYDDLGRMETRAEPEGLTTWIYDGAANGIGKLEKITAPDGFEFIQKYNPFGQPEDSITEADGEWYWETITYNSQNQVSQIQYPNSVSTSTSTSPGPDADRFRVNYSYVNGSADQVQEVKPDGTLGTIFWKMNGTNALGNVTMENLGGGLATTRVYDRVTGALTGITTGTNASHQNLFFKWDAFGNLKERQDYNRNMMEFFEYDDLHRLTKVDQYNDLFGSLFNTMTNQYDSIGNILAKNNFTNYQYTSGLAHAVSSVDTPAGTRIYDYDNNGNLESVSGGNGSKTVNWYSFNKARQITIDSTTYSDFWYGPDRRRYKHSLARSQWFETTIYVGVIYERQSKGAGIEHVHFVKVGGRTVAEFRRFTTGAERTRYLLRDHLGSVSEIVKEDFVVEESLSYGPWGKRRDIINWSNPGTGVFLMATYTDRGFTGHEHLDHVGLINMNGRIYDQELGRFLSPDPFTQFPESTQGLNRYSYVNNNPLSYTDPSGFFLKGLLSKMIGMYIAAVTGQQWLGDFVQGYLSSGGDIKAGITSVGFGKMSRKLKADGWTDGQIRFNNTLIGGGLSKAQGGKFFDAKSFVKGYLESIGQNLLVGPNSSFGQAMKELSLAGTDKSPGLILVEGAGGTSNGAQNLGKKEIGLSDLNDDNGYGSPAEAALEMARVNEDRYFDLNRRKAELSGYIAVQTGENGPRYYFSDVIEVPSGFSYGLDPINVNRSDVVALWHTHPPVGRDQEEFSRKDSGRVGSIKVPGIDYYLRTPGGDLRILTPENTKGVGHSNKGDSVCPDNIVPCLPPHPNRTGG